MNTPHSLYWIARCDQCGRPMTAHAMSVLREAMLCLACLAEEAEHMSRSRADGRTVRFAREAPQADAPKGTGLHPSGVPLSNPFI